MNTIVVPYSADQNAPSKPRTRLFDFYPHAPAGDAIIKLWGEFFGDHRGEPAIVGALSLRKCESSDYNNYGDWVIEDDGGDNFLFLTFVLHH